MRPKSWLWSEAHALTQMRGDRSIFPVKERIEMASWARLSTDWLSPFRPGELHGVIGVEQNKASRDIRESVKAGMIAKNSTTTALYPYGEVKASKDLSERVRLAQVSFDDFAGQYVMVTKAHSKSIAANSSYSTPRRVFEYGASKVRTDGKAMLEPHELADELGVTDRAVRRAVRQLVEAGWLRLESTKTCLSFPSNVLRYGAAGSNPFEATKAAHPIPKGAAF